jgi:predicted dehydrogenase
MASRCEHPSTSFDAASPDPETERTIQSLSASNEERAMSASPRQINIGVIGFGWMGRVHTQAYRRIGDHYPDLAVVPVLHAVADDVPGRGDEAAAQFGFSSTTRDWREVAADPSIDAVSITAPNYLHREIATSMAAAGKHIWIEKPVGLSAGDARAVADAVADAGVAGTVGFNYRNAPAVQHARELLDDGAIGRITHASFRLFSDYASHPDGALTWRFERERGGNGVLGDLMSHGVDLARYLLGDIESLVADTGLFVARRPRPSGATSGHALATGGDLGDVENDDYVSCLVRFASGAKGSVDASRVAVGAQNDYGFEIHGTTGCLAWNFTRMGELRASLGADYQDQPVATVFVGPRHGEYARFQPGGATPLSYDDLKVIELAGFLRSIEDGGVHGAVLADAVAAAAALEAMERSTATGFWQSP